LHHTLRLPKVGSFLKLSYKASPGVRSTLEEENVVILTQKMSWLMTHVWGKVCGFIHGNAQYMILVCGKCNMCHCLMSNYHFNININIYMPSHNIMLKHGIHDWFFLIRSVVMLFLVESDPSFMSIFSHLWKSSS
jgi:hypothetical protein